MGGYELYISSKKVTFKDPAATQKTYTLQSFNIS